MLLCQGTATLQTRYCTRSNKDFENGPHPKRLFKKIKNKWVGTVAIFSMLTIYSSHRGTLRIARRDKKAFLGDQCKEIEENNRI